MALLLAGELTASAAPQLSETQVKAEFVERFTHFVDWPPAAFRSPAAPFVVCTTGDSPLRAPLEKAVSRGQIQKRIVAVRQVRDPSNVEGCQILYLSPDTSSQLSAWLQRTNGRPILTIADTPGFGVRGTLVNLFVDGTRRVRFEVNTQAARQSGLLMSAQFLALARVIGPKL
jgi:hypothetical protein